MLKKFANEKFDYKKKQFKKNVIHFVSLKIFFIKWFNFIRVFEIFLRFVLDFELVNATIESKFKIMKITAIGEFMFSKLYIAFCFLRQKMHKTII